MDPVTLPLAIALVMQVCRTSFVTNHAREIPLGLSADISVLVNMVLVIP